MTGYNRALSRRGALACVLAALATTAPAQGAGDPAKGKMAYVQCMACHSLDKSGKSTLGPSLYRVVGRPVASVKGFAYSPAMIKQKGKWTPERIDAYLASPVAAIPGNRMAYGGMRNPVDRRNVLAYIVASSR